MAVTPTAATLSPTLMRPTGATEHGTAPHPAAVPSISTRARVLEQASHVTSSSRGQILGSELPRDVIRGAVQRLGVLAGVAALLIAAIDVVREVLQLTLGGAYMSPRLRVIMWTAIAASACMWALARKRSGSSQTLISIGLGYVVAVAALSSLTIVLRPWWATRGNLYGIPWTSLWIVLFPTFVPVRFRTALVTGLIMTATGPLALTAAITSWHMPPAPPSAYLDVTLPSLVATVAALVPAQLWHRLGSDVRSARRMGSYVLEERLGRGGMGEVWRARHRMLIRPAAVKLIRPERLGAAGPVAVSKLMTRFTREARATAALRSPHTVELYDFGVTDAGTLFYAMELLDGIDLRRLVERFGPIPPNRAVYMLRQICGSLAEAHAVRLIHRDIKPDNIFTCRVGAEYDFIKVLDFGLAKSMDAIENGEPELTMRNMALGTPAFMAPEVARAEENIDARADLYSLGCVAYWLLTGEHVFPGRTNVEIAIAHVSDPPLPPSARSSIRIGADLDAVVLACLAKNPSDRPRTAEELADRLGSCAASAPWTNEAGRSWWTTYLPTTDVISLAVTKSDVDAGADTLVEGQWG